MKALRDILSRYKIILLVAIWMSSYLLPAAGQDWNYSIEDIKTFPIHSFQPEDNKGSLIVLHLGQDAAGYIWVGTDHGLFRFDGNRFTHFLHDPQDEHSLDHNFASSIWLDSEDRLWVGTRKGVNLYRPETEDFERVNLDKASVNRTVPFTVRRITEDNLGRKYLSTNGGGVRVLTDDLTDGLDEFPLSEITRSPVEGMDAWNVNRVYFDSAEKLWISTIENGLLRFSPETGILESGKELGNLFPALAGHEVRALHLDGEGNLWVGTHGLGIIKWNETDDSIVHYNSGISRDRPFASDSVRQIREDNFGNMWVGTQDLGLFIYDPEFDSFEPISHSGSGISRMGEGTVSALFVDDRGDVWFTSLYSGSFTVFHLNMRPAGFRYTLVENEKGRNLAKNPTLYSYEDSRGDFWIGTDGEGLIRKNGESVRVFRYDENDPYSLSNDKVTSILEDENGNIWVGTRRGGLNRFIPETDNFERIPIGDISASIQGRAIWSLYADGNYLWVGTELGLNLYDIELKKAIDPRDVLGSSFRMPKRAVWSMVKDEHNCLWIGALPGLYVGKYIKAGAQVNSGDSGFRRVARFRIQSVHLANDGRVYVASLEEGMFRVGEDGSLERPFPPGKNFESEILHSVGQDLMGNFWLTTDGGFVRIEKETSGVTTFDSRWGFEAQYYWVHNALLGSDGRMYFPSRKGLLFFDPKTIGFQKETLVPMVTNVEGFDHSAWPKAKTVRFLSGQYPDGKLTFEHDEAILTFHYSALFFPQPTSIEYQTFLEGVDTDWSLPSTATFVTYPLLPAGEFSFKVRSRIVGQEWGEASEALFIHVLHPFYFQKWFVTLALLALGLTVYLVLQVRVRKMKAQRGALEATVSRRTSELNETNDQIIKQRDELEYHRNNLEKLIKERTAELESAKEKAEESSRLKTAFLANMSHEIRTPLNSIVNFSQLLFDQNLEESDRAKFKDIVENSSAALLRLIEDVLDIARLEAGELKIEMKPCDIVTMLHRLCETYQGKLRAHNMKLEITTQIPDGFRDEVETDVIRLNQILVNLLDNALKFTEVGEIVFGFEIKEEFVEFFVRDTGIGISKENLDKVFDRFTKIEEDRRKIFPGAGLGLAISRRLAGLLGGDIRVESVENEGSVFYFTIPFKVQDESVKTISETRPQFRSFDWKRYTILVVEDEYSNVEVIKAFLTPTAAKVVYAEDGDQAVSCVKSDSSIDLVLMDLKLPIMDGITATEAIRVFNRDVPIIAQTAFGVSHERMETLKCGFNDYVTKPLDRERLLSSIDHHLKQH